MALLSSNIYVYLRAMTEISNEKLAKLAAEESSKIVTQMMSERGRGAILVGGARIDTALESLLKSVMAPGSPKDDNLFKPDRPLGTFSAKIALASRLSLIDKPVEKALQTIRKVRNDFAHSFEDLNLSDSSYQSRLSEAYVDARRNPLWPKIEGLLIDAKFEDKLRDYVLLICVLVAFMEACSHLQRKFAPAIPVRFYRLDAIEHASREEKP